MISQFYNPLLTQVFTLLMIFVNTSVISQNLIPLPEDNPKWTYLESFLGGKGATLELIQFEYSEDSIINNQLYHTIQRISLNYFGDTIRTTYCYIRQEVETNSIWIIRKYLTYPYELNESIESEKLLVTLNTEIGTFVYLNALWHDNDINTDSLYQLTNIEPFLCFDGIERNLYEFQPSSFGWPLSFIEGIGVISQAFGPSLSNQHFNHELLCLELDGEMIYQEPSIVFNDVGNCNRLGSITAIETDVETPASLKLFPNPNNGVLYFSANGCNMYPIEIEIYNLVGKRLLAHTLHDTSSPIDISHLDTGVYLVNMYCDFSSASTYLILSR